MTHGAEVLIQNDEIICTDVIFSRASIHSQLMIVVGSHTHIHYLPLTPLLVS